jgi:hypothetical protein
MRIDGYTFTAQSKRNLIAQLQIVLERGELKFPFVRDLVDELQSYSWDDKDLQTDFVMALALAVEAAKGAGARSKIAVVYHGRPDKDASLPPWERD